MAKVYDPDAGAAPRRPGLLGHRAAHLPALPDRPRRASSAGTSTPLAAGVQPGVGPGPLRPAAPAGPPAVQPRPLQGRRAEAVVQHRGQLPDQHELAGLRRRRHEPPHPDGRPGLPQLRVGGRRGGGGGGAHPGPGPAPDPHHRQLLGRPGPHLRAHPAAARVRGRHRADEPGRDRQLPRLRAR